ncbi:ATP-binding protein [Candidatus Omnitrophota bacterium]
MPPLITTIYVVTIIVSLATAAILVHMAQLSARAKLQAQKKDREGAVAMEADQPQVTKVAEERPLMQTISEEITGIVESGEKRSKLSKKMSDVFDKELQKRVEISTQDINRKYKSIVEDSIHNKEIAWKKYKKVLADKKETEAVVRSIAEGLVVVDAKGNVVMMNPAAEKLVGTSKKDQLGRPITDNLKDEQLISMVRGGVDGEEKDIELISQEDETKKILRSSSAVIEDENGQTVGMVSVLSDVTKQRELDHMKSNFVSNITHELRTPLVSTQKSITLLLTRSTGQISQAQEHFLTVADRNLKRLSILIDDLLDLSKLEAGKMDIVPEDVLIGKVISEAAEGLSVWAHTKSIELRQKVAEGLPDVNIDANRIIQVLNNLVGNAIKFTPEKGHIDIEASLDGERNEVKVTVHDSGPGIAKENLPKVFDKFYQTGERNFTDISGTGIGLSISKEIVGLHGGRIWVESDEGQGARFIFTLPVKSS